MGLMACIFLRLQAPMPQVECSGLREIWGARQEESADEQNESYRRGESRSVQF